MGVHPWGSIQEGLSKRVHQKKAHPTESSKGIHFKEGPSKGVLLKGLHLRRSI